MSRPFDIFEVSKAWAQSQKQFYCCFLDEIESTNTFAKDRLLPPSQDQGLFLARHQTKGRGRSDNSWKDTGIGNALLSSWLFRLSQSPQHITGPLFGLALFRSAHKIWPNLEFSLKAPNDLYLRGNKIAGLLLETLNEENEFYLIAGLGFNVFDCPPEFPEATCLAHSFGSPDHPDLNKWFEFLACLRTNFALAAHSSFRSYLVPEDQSDLQLALNLNPKLINPISEVRPDGNLLSGENLIKWTEL
jgi:BirA family biotin operon repressor/biotin-[acetyl-CoA-carboxylase] ligase